MEEKYVRCESWNTVCGINSLSQCHHRIPHIHIKTCDDGCGKLSTGCKPGSFNKGDRYRLFGNIMIVTEIVDVCDERIITIRSDNPFLIITAYENMIIKILSKQIGV